MTEAETAKRNPFHRNLAYKLRTEGRLEELKAYRKWLTEHARYLRRLWREQRGIFVPGDFDGGYE